MNRREENLTTEYTEFAKTSTPLRGVDEQSIQGVAHSTSRQDEQKREVFRPSGAPGGNILKLRGLFSLGKRQ